MPPLPYLLGCFAVSVGLWWVPPSYYQVLPFERSGRLYERVGVRHFRWFVPDGDAANRWRRRREPAFRVVRNRQHALAFRQRTQMSEKGHLVLLVLGGISTAFAWAIAWSGWALYLGVGNVLVNLYPILLQRYTRARLLRVAAVPRRTST